MNKILDYAYLRRVAIDEENVYQLLVTSDYLSVLGVRELCCDFLKNKLDTMNCIGTMLFAR
jgi:hypothetical protein